MDNTPTITELQEAAENAYKGIRDPVAMRKASERMDVLREKIRSRAGITNIGSESIRELRDE